MNSSKAAKYSAINKAESSKNTALGAQLFPDLLLTLFLAGSARMKQNWAGSAEAQRNLAQLISGSTHAQLDIAQLS